MLWLDLLQRDWSAVLSIELPRLPVRSRLDLDPDTFLRDQVTIGTAIPSGMLQIDAEKTAYKPFCKQTLERILVEIAECPPPELQDGQALIVVVEADQRILSIIHSVH